MKANLKKLQILPLLDAPTAAWMRNLYEASFPPQERRPWWDLAERCLKGEILAYGISEGAALAGFITVWDFPDFAYLEHFAIDEQMRGRGLGSQVLNEIKILFEGKPIVLEVEPPTDNESMRRIRFYKSNGFCLHDDWDYQQPPYSSELPWVELKIMTFSKIPHSVDFEHIKTTLYSNVYNLS